MFHKHLKGVFTAAECQAMIAFGHSKGFEQALVSRGDGTEELIQKVRNNDRVIFDDMVLAANIEAKLKGEIPEEFKDVKFLNAGTRFRIYKYVPGQFFKPHRDGSVHDDVQGTDSEITLLIYLNDTDGGETVLMPHGKGQEWSFIHIAPKIGDVLMFEHNFWHEGKPVNSGEKYVLRTDLFYA